MKVGFLGDSITEGVPGVSYVNIVQDRLGDIECVNLGVGGDTVYSLLKRVKKMRNLHTYDAFVLFAGINDLFGKLNIQHRLIKLIQNQKSARNDLVFKRTYNELLLYLRQFNKKLIVIPPLLLGEKLNNTWNLKVQKLAKIVEEQATFYKDINYLDIRSVFVERLQNKKVSPYLPTKPLAIKRDMDTLKTKEITDSKSIERGLHLTLDGVHINSIGANIIARELVYQLQRLK